MLDFKAVKPADKQLYEPYLRYCAERGCEYSFANMYLWGRQKATLHEGNLAFFSQFYRKSVYKFPLGENLRPTLDAIIADSRERGIPCRITCLTAKDKKLLEQWYPEQFYFQPDRDSYDYVYSVDALADLKGKKLQRKRNHCNRFWDAYPETTIEPITEDNTPQVENMLEDWYTAKLAADPTASFYLEQAAISRALQSRQALGMEGLALICDGKVIAMTMGSPLSSDTFDIHFEKAAEGYDGAYAAINREFARYLREKHPKVQWLNREDDMGLEGLRKAKLSYYPDKLIEKWWACLKEEGYDC